MNRKKIGDRAEDLVVSYLKAEHHIILKRNYYTVYGEIDIICEKDGIIFFIEGKSHARELFCPAEFAFNNQKQKRLLATINQFIYTNNINEYQIDLAVVYWQSRKIYYYHNAEFDQRLWAGII